MHTIPIFSTLVTFACVVFVFRRYLLRHGTHLLVWSIGLLFFGLGTLSEVVLGLTFSGLMLRVWYLSGAMLTAAWLGQGTVHLLVRKHGVARNITIGLALGSLLAVVLVMTAAITPAAASYQVSQPISSQYKDILTRGGLTIALTILLNIYGTLTLVGGAIYSVVIFFRKHVLANRMIGSLLIAIGAMAPAMAGSFVTLGLPDLLYLSELIGVILIFIGFLRSTMPIKKEAIVPAPAQ